MTAPQTLRVKLDAAPTVLGLPGYPEHLTGPLTPLEALMMAEIRDAYQRTPPRTQWAGYRMAGSEDRPYSVGVPGWRGDLNHDLTPREVLMARLEQEAA